MIRINLIPYRQARRQKRFQQILIAWGVVVLASVAVCFIIDTMITDQRDEHIAQKTQLEEQIKSLDTKLGAITSLQERQKILEHRIQVIGVLRKRAEVNIKLLDTVTKALPDLAWIDKLSSENNVMTIRGQAEANSEVAKLINNLKATNTFTAVELDHLTKTDKTSGTSANKESSSMRLMEFTIEGVLNSAGLEMPVNPVAKNKKK